MVDGASIMRKFNLCSLIRDLLNTINRISVVQSVNKGIDRDHVSTLNPVFTECTDYAIVS